MDSIKRLNINFLMGENIRLNHYTDFPEIGIHSHNYYELIFFKKANAISVVNGKEITFGDNSLYLLTPFDFHETKKSNSNFEIDYINISFPSESIDNEILKKIDGAYYLESAESDIITLFELLECYKLKKMHRNMSLILSVLLDRIVNSGILIKSEGKVDSELEIVRKAAKFVNENYSTEITLSTISKALHLSPSYFSGVFSSSSGITFTEYLQKYRLNVAKHLLTSTDLPIIEVALSSGFSSYSRFSRVFKEVIGQTPTLYRQNKTAK